MYSPVKPDQRLRTSLSLFLLTPRLPNAMVDKKPVICMRYRQHWPDKESTALKPRAHDIVVY